MPNVLVAKATAALQESVASIIGCDESDATKREALAETFGQFQDYLAKSFAGDEPDRRNDGNVGGGDHHASKVADLLVEAGSFPHRAAALQHLLHKPSGQALLQRMHKAESHTGKDRSIMDRTTELRDIAKAGGNVAVAKSICDENRSYGISEHEFVALATEHAKAAHPELTEAAAFAKLYENPAIWRACNVLKSMPVADLTPLVVGGFTAQDEAINNTEQSEAYRQLLQIGKDRWPGVSESQAFTNALTDPANAALANRALRRPSATTSYQMPR